MKNEEKSIFKSDEISINSGISSYHGKRFLRAMV